jgi:hypothetical protein
MYYVDNGSRYEGPFVDGEKHGRGKMFYDCGDVFEGTWVNGKRHGRGIISYAPSRDDERRNKHLPRPTPPQVGYSFEVQWRNDVCEMVMNRVNNHIPALPEAEPYESLVSPLGTDLRYFRVVPDLWVEVHPAHFRRIKTAFELLDRQANGELDMDHLKQIWDPNNMETLLVMEKAATTVGDDNTLELIEVLIGLYPHLPHSELRRWTLTDLTPEYLHRLRGYLADVPAVKQDGFYFVSQGRERLSKDDAESFKGHVGGVRVSHSMFVRNRLLRGEETLTFPDMLREVFPNLWNEVVVRVELTAIPTYALDGYAAAFRLLDESDSGYLSLEQMKVAQRRFQNAIAAGQSKISMPTNSYEERIQRGIFKHQGRWLIGDISVTINLVKSIDRLRSGFVAFSEVLRVAFPNVPCQAMKDRLLGTPPAAPAAQQRHEELCECCICRFCMAPQFAKPKPASPYTDGTAVW